MAALPQKRWTVDDYLIYDRDHEGKHEYVDGQFYAMAGATRIHNLVVSATNFSLFRHARKRGCEVYPSDMRVRTPSQLYTYPDLVIVCGQSEVIKEHGQDTLLNPTLIIEVLSPTTERFDRTGKFQHYKTLPSLMEYVLVAQDAPFVERFLRQSDGQWLHAAAAGLDASIALITLDYVLPLREVYEQIAFDE
jgi:Uma2 family endonuclease